VSQIPPAPGESEPREVKAKSFLAKRL
jgi:hypothetical protein